MPSVLILTGASVGWMDPNASEVAHSVARRIGGHRVSILGSLELATATWEHRIEGGVARTRLTLGPDRIIETEQVGAVLNLVRSLPALGLSGANERDRAYADVEMQALFVSFLRGFRCRVINDVDGQGPLGMWSNHRWSALAHQCQMSTRLETLRVGTRLVGHRTPTPATGPGAAVIVVGDRVIGDVPDSLKEQCRDLASLAGCELVGMTFEWAGEPRLIAVDPFPALSGEVAEAVADALCADVGQSAEGALR